MSFLLVILIAMFYEAKSYNFDVDNAIQFKLNLKSYFGYSLLLQKGEEESILIVGAPKSLRNPLRGGEVYRCQISSDGNSITSCERYSSNTYLHDISGSKEIHSTSNGDFFGGSIDGGNFINEPFVACAPRYENIYEIESIEGICILMNSSSIYGLHQKLPQHARKLAMNGFDASFISEHNILTGAPVTKILEGSVEVLTRETWMGSFYSSRLITDPYKSNGYFGYAVTNIKSEDDLSYIASVPRGSDLKGKIIIFSRNIRSGNALSLEGFEVGSYFGASILAEDFNNDGITDLLVGAPLSSGRSYDEGKVYYYQGGGYMQFDLPNILIGSSSMGAKFGSKIVSLGDFDLDGYNDAAISAPYENGGAGAVYIYRGGKNGLTDDYSQKIVSINGSLGFGLGLSRGNDVDNNGHNDLAIGAYLSDTIIVIKSKPIIDQEVFLSSPLNSIPSTIIDNNIHFQMCIIYKSRNPNNKVQSVEFSVYFDLDYRIDYKNLSTTVLVHEMGTFCKDYDVQLKNETITDISPLQIKVATDVISNQIDCQQIRNTDLQIPFSHDCGDDNFCTPDLYVNISSKIDHIVLGRDQNIVLNIKVKNENETAYQCEIVFSLPEEIGIVRKGCMQVRGEYRCLVADFLMRDAVLEEKFSLDIGKLYPDKGSIEIKAKVVSLGKQIKNATNTDSFRVAIVLDSTPFIQWESVPDNLAIDLGNSSDQHFMHTFKLGKHGISPLKIEMNVLIPLLEQDGRLIFEIDEIEGMLEGRQLPRTFGETDDIETIASNIDLSSLKIAHNRTVILSVVDNKRVLQYRFSGAYLYNEELAYFRVKMFVRSKFLGAKFRTDLVFKDIIAFAPSVTVQNSNQSLYTISSLLLIFVNKPSTVPLWVYLLAPTVGVLLVILISSALYRCQFFNREYKNKLEQEKHFLQENIHESSDGESSDGKSNDVCTL